MASSMKGMVHGSGMNVLKDGVKKSFMELSATERWRKMLVHNDASALRVVLCTDHVRPRREMCVFCKKFKSLSTADYSI